MPSPAIEKLGRFISRQVGEHPEAGPPTAPHRLQSGGGADAPDSAQKRAARPVHDAGGHGPLHGRRAGEANRAACVNIFLPCELLHALDIPPVLPEGLSCYLVSTAAERVFVEAAEERGGAGQLLLLPQDPAGPWRRPASWQSPGLCSTPPWPVTPTSSPSAGWPGSGTCPTSRWTCPFSPAEDSVAYVAEQLRAMGDFVQAHTGRTPVGGRPAGGHGPLPGHGGGLPPLPGAAGGAAPVRRDDLRDALRLRRPPHAGSQAALEYRGAAVHPGGRPAGGAAGEAAAVAAHTPPTGRTACAPCLNFREGRGDRGLRHDLDTDLLPDPEHPTSPWPGGW